MYQVTNREIYRLFSVGKTRDTIFCPYLIDYAKILETHSNPEINAPKSFAT